MGINWKLRLMNKTTLAGICSSSVIFAYSVLGVLGITPAVDQEFAIYVVMSVLSVVCAIAGIVDPTTEGIGDSAAALGYEEPFTVDKGRGED